MTLNVRADLIPVRVRSNQEFHTHTHTHVSVPQLSELPFVKPSAKAATAYRTQILPQSAQATLFTIDLTSVWT